MTKITSKSAIKMNDIVKHEFRKTLTFKVTETSPKVIIRRCDPHSFEVQTRYKGYSLAPRDFSQGHITLVSNGPKIANKVIKISATAKITTVAELAKKDIFNEFENIIVEFLDLENQLSPENLTCDGEATNSQVASRRKEIMRKWSLLEMYVGQTVTAEA